MAICLACGTARADVAEARKHYERGTQAFNLQDFKAALAEFKLAYVEQADPVFLFNIAQAQRQLGEYETAAKSYRLYLANQPDAPNREQVERFIAQMDTAAEQQRRTKPALAVEVQRPAISSAPTAAPTKAAPQPIALVDTGKPMRVAGILTADAGLALIGVGIAFAVLSKQAGDDAYHPASGVYDHAADERQTSFRNGDIACFVVGGAVLVAGTTLWLVGRKRRQTPRAARMPVVTARGMAVSF